MGVERRWGRGNESCDLVDLVEFRERRWRVLITVPVVESVVIVPSGTTKDCPPGMIPKKFGVLDESEVAQG